MQNNKKYKHLYIPIEIKVREFDAKLLFSLMAAESGFRVILGAQKDLRKKIAWWPQGIYLDKSAAYTKTKWFKYFRKFGHKVVAWDEEGLIIHPDSYLDRRFSGKSFALLEKFFTWGEFHSNVILERYVEGYDKIAAVGNPRMDMLRPELRSYYNLNSRNIIEKYGKIILINTSFSLSNHIINSEVGKKGFLRNHPEMNEKFIDDWIKYQHSIFQAFGELLPVLRSFFPEHAIVVRPHPAENKKAWAKIAASIENVHVVHEGNVIKWIQAADVMIHSNCTTSVESFLLGTPCIAYQPVSSDDYDTYLPNVLSWSAKTREEVIGIVKKYIDDQGVQLQTEARMKEAQKYVSAIDGQLSCEKIIDHLNLLDLNPSGVELGIMEKIGRLSKELIPMFRRVFNNIKNEQLSSLKSRLLFNKNSKAAFQQKIHNQTIPNITLDEVEYCISRFRECMQRFHSVKVRDIGNNCFVIDSDDYERELVAEDDS
jgi:surface carbohydrate biosynthesis protein